MASFSELGIKSSYIKSIQELGISTPTQIQEQTIPVLLNSKTDFIGLAQTGTGKTAAFGLPILHHIDASSDNIQTLVENWCNKLKSNFLSLLNTMKRKFLSKLFLAEKR